MIEPFTCLDSVCLKCTGRWILSSGPRISHCSFTARELHLKSPRHARTHTYTHTHILLLMTAFCHGLDMLLWVQVAPEAVEADRPQWASCSSAMMLSWASSSSRWTTCASEDTCIARCKACDARRGLGEDVVPVDGSATAFWRALHPVCRHAKAELGALGQREKSSTVHVN